MALSLKALLFVLITAFLNSSVLETQAFVVCNPTQQLLSPRSRHCVLSARGAEDDGDDREAFDDDDDDDDVRRKLESLIQDTSSEDNKKGNQESPSQLLRSIIQNATQTSTWNAMDPTSESEPLDGSNRLLPPPPPLSSIERTRRETEVALLEGLEQGDEASAYLWNFWYSERGEDAKQMLEDTDPLMGDPTSWQECEARLYQLTDEYGWYFCEPLNRLATLYYLQGRLEESYVLCQIILTELKPWHFGALSGIVQVCIGLDKRDWARHWAQRRLPSLAASASFPPFDQSLAAPTNPRRAEWVQKMTALARQRLEEAEKTTQQHFFGRPEDYYYRGKTGEANSSSQGLAPEDGVEDAWQ